MTVTVEYCSGLKKSKSRLRRDTVAEGLTGGWFERWGRRQSQSQEPRLGSAFWWKMKWDHDWVPEKGTLQKRRSLEKPNKNNGTLKRALSEQCEWTTERHGRKKPGPGHHGKQQKCFRDRLDGLEDKLIIKCCWNKEWPSRFIDDTTWSDMDADYLLSRKNNIRYYSKKTKNIYPALKMVKDRRWRVAFCWHVKMKFNLLQLNEKGVHHLSFWKIRNEGGWRILLSREHNTHFYAIQNYCEKYVITFI